MRRPLECLPRPTAEAWRGGWAGVRGGLAAATQLLYPRLRGPETHPSMPPAESSLKSSAGKAASVLSGCWQEPAGPGLNGGIVGSPAALRRRGGQGRAQRLELQGLPSSASSGFRPRPEARWAAKSQGGGREGPEGPPAGGPWAGLCLTEPQ